MTRIMPIKKNLKEEIIKAAVSNLDNVFDLWWNNIAWHKFLDKRPELIAEPKEHKISIHICSVWLYDGKWGACDIWADFDWLKEELSYHSYDAPPELEGDESFSVPINHWELPGQRFLENFENAHLNEGA